VDGYKTGRWRWRRRRRLDRHRDRKPSTDETSLQNPRSRNRFVSPCQRAGDRGTGFGGNAEREDVFFFFCSRGENGFMLGGLF
jgi:hypothetical protein